uniref:Uncharacterized protein n=1 Tax=viral metagenome TaxID=1070528 RepID=A0A6M3JVT1_9ZZZZ
MNDRIEYLRSMVRPILLIEGTMFLFIFAFYEGRVDPVIVKFFMGLVGGGWTWYFGERAWQKLRGK